MAFFRRKRSLPKRRLRSRLRLEPLEARRLLATYVVDSTADNDMGFCAAGKPEDNDACTIRSAIIAAEQNAGPDTIQITSGIGTYFIDLGSFDLFEAQDLTFTGDTANAADVVIDGQNDARGFDILGSGSPYNVTFRNLTIQNGIARDGSGGAAINAPTEANLTLENVVLQNNVADIDTLFPSGGGSSGGAVQASGIVTISSSVIRNNTATADGGGLDLSGDVTITNTVIRDNVAARNGGGISFETSANNIITIRDTSLLNNTTGETFPNGIDDDIGFGGGMYVSGTNAAADLLRVAVEDNVAGDSGAGVYVNGGTITVNESNFRTNTANGDNSGGGGLYVFSSAPASNRFTINGGEFRSNSAVAGAGGFEANQVGGTIDGTSFILNQVTGDSDGFDQGGGAVAILAGDPALAPAINLSNLLVDQNNAPVAGGLAMVNANVTIADSTITANTSRLTNSLRGGGGIGGVSGFGGTPIRILRSTVANNISEAEAGGIGVFNASLAITDTSITNNQARNGRGGGIGIAGQNIIPVAAIDSSTISGNSATSSGGGVALLDANIQLLNTTVSGNTSAQGGGLAYSNNTDANDSSIIHSTIASNIGSVLDGNLAAQGSAALSIASSIIADGRCLVAPGAVTSGGFNVFQDPGCSFGNPDDLTSTDPMLGSLANNGGPVLTHALQPGSPAIDLAPTGPAVDARDINRPQDGDADTIARFDAGAFEAEQVASDLVVDELSDVDDGDFSPGRLSLREAIQLANSRPGEDTITFGGVFTDGIDDTLVMTGFRYEITDSLTIDGPTSEQLTIDGNDSTQIFNVQSFEPSIDVTLNQLSLTGGSALASSGGAISVSSNVTLTVNDSRLFDNVADEGGAIFNSGTLFLNRSTVENNSSVGQSFGGGAGISNSGSLTIQQSTITGNSALQSGGAILHRGTDLTVTQSVISGNTASTQGGGIRHLFGSLVIAASTLENNSALGGAGAVSVENGDVTVDSSTISGNTGEDGGAIEIDAGTLRIINSTISGNQGTLGTGGVSVAQDDPEIGTLAVFVNSTIVGNIANSSGGAGFGSGGIQTSQSDMPPVNTRLFNTIVAGNTQNIGEVNLPSDIGGKAVDPISASNLIGDPASSGGLVEGANNNLVGDGSGGLLTLDQILEVSLADNGGTTLTHALIPGSRAIDTGDNSLATTPGDDDIPGTGDDGEGVLVNDQRGDPFSRVFGGAVDVGAFESTLAPQVELSISDVVVREDAAVATLTVTLEGTVPSSIQLSYQTTADSAVANDDYTPIANLLLIGGEAGNQVTIDIPIVNDQVSEAREKFNVELGEPPPGVTLADSQGTVTIIDDDVAVLTVSDATAAEDSGAISFSVTLNGDVDTSFTVEASPRGIVGGAVPDDDFIASTQTVNFMGFDGETQTVTVSLLSDNITELDEAFELLLGNIQAAGRRVQFAGGQILSELSVLGEFDPAGAIEASAVTASGDLGFVSIETESNSLIYVLDISDPANVTVLDSVVVSALGSDLVVDESRGLLFATQRSDGVLVLDISDPGNVTQAGSFVTLDRTDQLQLVGDLAYVTIGFSGIEVLDVSDPANIVSLGSFDTPGVTEDIQVLGNVAFVSDTSQLLSLDVSDPASITLIDQFTIANSGSIEPLFLDGTTLYAATGGFSSTLMRVFDVSDPANLTLISEFTGPQGFTDDVVVEGGVAYVTDQEGAGVLTTIDVTDPADPTLIEQNPNFRDAHRIAIVDGRAFINATTTGPGFAILGNINTTAALGTILNDDQSTLTISNASLLEDQGSMVFTVTLSGAVDTSVAVTASTRDLNGQNNAVAGEDYTVTSEQLLFTGNDGETLTVLVPILPDSDEEPNETFSVELSNLLAADRNVVIEEPGNGIGTILNDDAVAPVDVRITKTDSIDPVAPGASLTYTMVVTNSGPGLATGVTVLDSLPSDVIFVSGNVDGDSSRVTLGDEGLQADIGDLSAGLSSTVTVTVTVSTQVLDPLVNTATVTANELDINDANDTVSETTAIAVVANNDSLSIDEDSDTVLIDVLANDLPIAGLTVLNVSSGSLGNVSIASGGTRLSYTPAPDAFGIETLTYTVVNASGEQASAQVEITINPVNDAPNAVDDVIDVPQRGTAIIDAADLLQNDSAGGNESDFLSVIEVSSTSAAGGVVTLSEGLITYQPPAGFQGLSDTFTYTLSDDGEPSLSDVATVTLQFPPPPAMLSGHVFCDANGNDVEDPGEAAVGTTIFIDENGNRRLDEGERSTQTDSAGDYVLPNLVEGKSTVVAQVPAGCATIPSNPGVSRSVIDVGRLARSIAMVDVDQDEDLDLIVAADFSNAVTVLENIGGTFRRSETIPVGLRPQNLSRTRMEGSNLVAVSSIGTPTDEGQVSILDGAEVVSTIQAGNGPIDAVIDDFDNNGIPDVAVASFRTSDVQLVLNGTGEALTVGDAPLALAIDSGDVNQDGNADIVLGGFGYPGDETSRVALLLGDGTGGFSEPIFADPIRSLVDLQVVSLKADNGVSPPAILTLSSNGELASYVLEQGELVQLDSTSIPNGFTSLATGNFNGDEFLDVAIANIGDQQIDLLIGDGDGSFFPITSITNVAAPSDLVVGDLDGDMIDDIAVSNFYQDVNEDPEGAPIYRLPSTATVLLLNVAESEFVITGGSSAVVDFKFEAATVSERFDVSGEGEVTALDALRVINALERSSDPRGSSNAEGEQLVASPLARTDVNGDGRTSALDALMIINYLARQETGSSDLALFSEDEDEIDRVAAVDLIFTQFLF